MNQCFTQKNIHILPLINSFSFTAITSPFRLFFCFHSCSFLIHIRYFFYLFLFISILFLSIFLRNPFFISVGQVCIDGVQVDIKNNTFCFCLSLSQTHTHTHTFCLYHTHTHTHTLTHTHAFCFYHTHTRLFKKSNFFSSGKRVH